MKILIVHAHHEPASFNGALTRTATAHLTSLGHEVQVSDLYAMGWNPVSDRRNFTTVSDPAYLKQQAEETYASAHAGFAPDVQAEMHKLQWCDGLIFQFPLWWFGLPAILKGWVDRVFAMGFAYGNSQMYEKGVFRGKRAMLSLTTGGPASAYAEEGNQHGTLSEVLFPTHHGIFKFTGMTQLPPFVVYGPARLTPEQREQELGNYRNALEGFTAPLPTGVPLATA